MRKIRKNFPGGGPPFFVSPLPPRDEKALTLSMGGRSFSTDLVLGVACRCPYGFPQVLLCDPLRRGRPFPTNFWLVCPWLQGRCASLESSGGVSFLEAFLAGKVPSSSWVAWHLEHARIRLSLLQGGSGAFMRRHRAPWWSALAQRGIGGSELRFPPRVKCLHLQMASCLALGWHPGEEWIEKAFPSLSCPSPGRCFSERTKEGGFS
jgi:hypothetical protein